MTSKKHEFKTAILEDESCVVLRVDPSQPHIMEVVASFYDAARARDYARFENGEQGEHQEDAPIEEPASKPKPPPLRLSRKPLSLSNTPPLTSANGNWRSWTLFGR